MLIGVLGGGQLGQMLGQAGISLGARFRFFDPAPSSPACAVGEHMHAQWTDEAALTRFCQGLDVCTFEFENVPVATLEFCAARVPTFPNVQSLTTGQDRASEKAIFAEIGFDVPAFALVSNEAELQAAIAKVGVPCVLKSRRGGYDGKGQAVVRDANQAVAAWDSIGRTPAVLEAFVPFSRELSIIACRGQDGQVVTYPLIENTHIGGILACSLAPAAVSPATADIARDRAQALLKKLDYCGTLAIEMFEVLSPRGPQLVPNEFAPRVHNTGHWTIEGAAASQFENHIRAIMGLPLGDTAVLGSCAMVNLIGRHEPVGVLGSIPGTNIHLYGKAPREGRKLGHLTVVAPTPEMRDSRLQALRKIAKL